MLKAMVINMPSCNNQLMLLNFPVVARFLKMMCTCETRSVNSTGCV